MKREPVRKRQRIAGRRSGFAAAAVIAAVLCLCAGCGKNQVPTKNTNAGYEANEASDFRSAEASFREAVANGEDLVQANRGLGIALMGQAKYNEALDAFGQALAATDDKMPETVEDILKYRITCQYRLKDYEECIKTGEELIKMDSRMVMPYYYIGASRLNLGNLDDAEANFDYAVSCKAVRCR